MARDKLDYGIAKEHDGTDPGSSAENVRVPAISNRQGCQYVDISHPYNFHTAAAYAATQAAATLAGAVTGFRSFISDIVIGGNTAGSIEVRQQTDSNTSSLLAQAYIGANGGYANLHFINPLIAIVGATDKGAILVTTSMTNTSVVISGYRAP